MYSHEKRKELLYFALALAIAAVTILMAVFNGGCVLLDKLKDIPIEDVIPIPLPDPDPVAVVDWQTLPVEGEWTPDPGVILYEFSFADGTLLRFREDHPGDRWGMFPPDPPGCWGTIIWPDGGKNYIDANIRIRHNSMGHYQMPVTTASHGKRYYWWAEVDNSKNVPIFEDGWGPGVESAVLCTQDEIGIAAELTGCKVTVEN